jgi:hypothetical protein
MLDRKLVGSALFAVALLGGGVAGAVLGVPGVSFAQESDTDTTTPDTASPDTTTPDTTAPDTTDDSTPDSRPDHDCPENQESADSATATNAI